MRPEALAYWQTSLRNWAGIVVFLAALLGVLAGAMRALDARDRAAARRRRVPEPTGADDGEWDAHVHVLPGDGRVREAVGAGAEGGAVSTPSGLFGGNSEGGMRMEEWLAVMCRGCVKDRGRAASGGMGGFSCGLPAAAYADPNAELPEWSADASPKPARLAELGDGPWPACMAYVPRKKRSDAGTRRPPKGMEPMFEMSGDGR
jgi:hypothetical protein